MNLYLIELVRYLASQSWQIAVLTVAVAVVTFALRHRSAHIRYLLWLMVVAKCLVPPLHVTPLRVLPPVLERTPSSSLPAARSPDPSPVPNPILPDTLKALHDAVSFPVDRGPDFPPSTSVAVLLSPLGRATAILWLIGAVSYLVMNLLRVLRGHYWLRKRRKPLLNGMQADTPGLLAAYGARRLPRVYLVDGASQPFVWGLLRGSIYVPPSLLSLESPEHRRDILAHELSHVLRFDAAVNALQIVAQSLFWFHPFVWWANSTIRREREKCCDEMVIARLHTTPKDYSTAIVEILARAKESGRSVPSLAVASPLKHIEGRIRTILRPGKRFHARPSLPVVTLVIPAALAAVPTTLVVTALAVEPVALARPLGGFPRTLNGWTGEELEIPTTVQEYMRANFADDFLNRRYTNKASQQWADLYMVYCSSRPGAILSHRPEVSFPANGWIHDGTRTSQITSHSGRSIDCLIHRFHKPSPQPTEVTVLCFYLVNGRISVNEQDFSHPSARRLNVSGNPAQYVAQVELSSTVEDSVRSAASALADAILDSLPDPNGRISTSQSAEAHLEQEANKQPATAGMNESNALPSPLAEFPRTLNGWTGEDLEIHTTVQEYMRANFADDFISRRYTNEATRQWADLYIVCCSSRSREILRHRPLLCYPGNGWIWDQTVPSHITTSSNRIFLCVTHRFHLPTTQQLAVLCFYVVDNKIMSDQDLSLRLARETDPPRYVAQVQISSVQEDAVHSATNAMADALAKTFAIRGPSVAIV